MDELDRALVEAAQQCGALGVWRAWSAPDRPLGVRRRYLVEMRAGEASADVLTRSRRALAAAGEPQECVDVFDAGMALADRCRSTLTSGVLLWVDGPRPPVRVARVFDEVDPLSGPSFAPGHLVIVDERERDRILRYLNGGTLILGTPDTMDDVVDGARAVVPSCFRTDGQWVWTDAVAHYLGRHHLAPDDELLDHIRAHSYAVPPVSVADIHRVLTEIAAPAAGVIC